MTMPQAHQVGMGVAMTACAMTTFAVPGGMHTAWTLVRNGCKLTCSVLHRSTGEHIVRLSQDGKRLLDETCASPQQALEKSDEALHLLVAHGWTHERGAVN